MCDPKTGRFTSADPLGDAGGGNPYAYAANNPVANTDRSGQCVPCLVGMAVGGVAGFGLYAATHREGFERDAALQWAFRGSFIAVTLGVALPAAGPTVARVGSVGILHRITTAQNARLASNPALARALLSPGRSAAGQVDPRIARVEYGRAVEKLTAASIQEPFVLSRLFTQLGGANEPDFVGRGPFQGLIYHITTPGQVAARPNRPYGPWLNFIIYARPDWFRMFP